ncbi:MAG: hypothetical protein EXS36_08615 [Pedosphaera sp.]|nr:hypothetical protein [Pedosphaera sp.]
MKPIFLALYVALQVSSLTSSTRAADAVFSGPQAREKTTPFKVLEVTGANAGKERDPVTENAGAPTALVFIHTVERSLVPLLRVVDEFGAEHRDTLKTEVVFLFGDRVAGEARVKAVMSSLKLQSRVGLSLDGAEGPGNFGLNKECMMTVVIAKDNVVTANFALVQPGIADAPKVIEALAKACGDNAPPTVAQLTEQQTARTGGGERMGRDGARADRVRTDTMDFSKFDLSSETGLRDAVKALIGEVQSLRTEVAALRGPMERTSDAPKRKESFPGAVPDDAKLNSLLRQFIRPTNDDAAVDKFMTEVETHIQGNANLTRQAMDGWTRVLHFSDRYGTPYSRKVGQAFLDKLKAAAPPSQ